MINTINVQWTILFWDGDHSSSFIFSAGSGCTSTLLLISIGHFLSSTSYSLLPKVMYVFLMSGWLCFDSFPFFFASSLENNLLDINWQFGNMSFHLDSQTMSFFNAILGWTRWLLNATLCASCLHSLIWSRKGHTLMTLCSQTSGADISTVSFKKILKLK